MPNEAQKIDLCPDTEKWCGYVDGSLQGQEKERLAEHLRQCDHCFSQVISIRESLETKEEVLHPTPKDLLQRAQQASPHPPKPRRPIYAIAAILVLGLGIGLLYQQSTPPWPSDIVLAQLSEIDTELQNRNQTWLPIASEKSRSVPAVALQFDCPASAKAAFNAGAVLLRLKVLLEYAHTIGDAPNQLDILKSEWHPLQPEASLVQAVEDLSTKLKSASASPQDIALLLPPIHRNIAQHVQAHYDGIAIYFYLGQWLQALQTASIAANVLAQPFAMVFADNQHDETIQKFISRLRDAGAPKNLLQALEDLNRQIKQTGANPQQSNEILKRTSLILNAFPLQ